MATQRFSNVLILTGCPHATVNLYRGVHLQEQLTQLGSRADVRAWCDQALPATTISEFDLLVLQRTAMSANLARVIEAMQAAGKPVLFDTDDLVFEPTMIEWHRGAAQLPPSEQALYADGVRRTLATLEASDAVLGASPLLVELARRSGKPAFLHRNAVGVEMQQLGDRLYAHRGHLATPAPAGASAAGDHQRAGLVRIGYGSGTPTHDVDFAEVVPALLDVLARHPQVELWLMGPLAAPRLLEIFRTRIRRFPLLGWQAYLELASQLDIMLAPLEANNIFCRAKSEIKFVEAGLLGIPTVASRSDPFAGVIEPGVNGWLAGNTVDWIAGLETLITQPSLRSQIGDAARQTVLERYTLTARAAELAETLAAISDSMPPSRIGNRQSHAPLRQDGATSVVETASAPVNQEPDQPVTSLIQSSVALESGAPSLVLNWVVTEPFRGSGGHLGVFRMVQHLVAFGHECHVYVKPIEQMHGWPAEQIRYFVDQTITPTGAHFHLWTGRSGAADATIATHWSTVDDVLQLPTPGQRYYFVQDFEPYFYPVGSEYVWAENSYRQGFHCLTLGPWLAKLMVERYGAKADHFDFAVDTDIYWPQPLPRPAHPRVAFYARPSTPRRAYELGIEALTLVKRQYPEVEIILFGANEAPPPPFMANVMGVRNPYELAALYSTCDVGMVLSLTNPSFVPFEMMACKCAVVDLRSERVDGLLVDRQNARLADPTPASIADAILDLLWDKALHSAIVEHAFAQTGQLSWQSSARQIERVLLAQTPPAERQLTRRVHGEDAESLLWQINQLLDRRHEQHEQTAKLADLLQRTLEEKAALAEQLRQTEATVRALQQSNTRFAPLRNRTSQTLAEAPTWVLGQKRLSKLPLDEQVIAQQFTATAADLAAIELRFTPFQPSATGALHLSLHDLVRPDAPVAEQTVLATEIDPDRPFVFRFAAQPYANGRIYQLRFVAPAGQFAYALWRYWAVASAGAHLQRNGQALRGQLAFAPAYDQPGSDQQALAWAQPPQPLASVAYSAGERTVRESGRLARQTWRVLHTAGPLRLLRELSNYLRWRVGQWLNG